MNFLRFRVLMLSILSAACIQAEDAPLPPAVLNPPPQSGDGYFRIHKTLGLVALGSFAGAMAISAGSGNLGKLTDPHQCCPDGGNRAEPWRTVDRGLVNVGIVAYLGAGGMALYNMGVLHPNAPRTKHKAHRWLALAHGTAFATSMVTGIIMGQSQAADPNRFASAARIHVASNILFVPLLTLAFGDILFE